MKTFILISLFSVVTMASEVQCLNADVSIKLSDFSTENETGNSNNADSIYERLVDCEQDVFFGNLCYKGSPKDATTLLENISLNLFEQAGEYSIIDISNQADQSISYDIFDGPNDRVIEKNTITRCQ
ncbi:MAG: hypothetical protein A2622_12655 [Bdellovibrionales bacterium RIFCSPHIGHO2_01_FULL_40_29]|nr:MAG: hypothetical protein A2622_12655 [Bdellovibrionales bacterium RIFCSPHIGHO2_01_FULL_40_29]OFZ33455.1 MAG: hypothetical protein A3D17_14230 [Bdellovibrionales bacterium RIFCSPHIGHO2_02_FULL_40_15]